MMLSNYEWLGTGAITITQININDMSANEAIWRIRSLENKILKAKLHATKPDDILEIAKYALKGSKEISLSKKCYSLEIPNVDIYELTEIGLKDRMNVLEKRMSNIAGIHSFLELARVALTGVPF